MRIVPCLLALALLATGCVWFNKKPTPSRPDEVHVTNTNGTTTTMIETPNPDRAGSVVRVNLPARFVVVNFAIGSMPEMGHTMFVYRQGLKVGEVKVTGPQQDDNTAADIVSGDAQVGDEIRAK